MELVLLFEVDDKDDFEEPVLPEVQNGLEETHFEEVHCTVESVFDILLNQVEGRNTDLHSGPNRKREMHDMYSKGEMEEVVQHVVEKELHVVYFENT